MKSPNLTLLVPLVTYTISMISSRQVLRIKNNYWLIQFQILQPNITEIVWQTIRRIPNEILRVKGAKTHIVIICTRKTANKCNILVLE